MGQARRVIRPHRPRLLHAHPRLDQSAASAVLDVGDGFQVVGVDAPAVLAQVVQLHAFGYGAVGVLVVVDVGADDLAAPLEVAVALFRQRPPPQPARGIEDLEGGAVAGAGAIRHNQTTTGTPVCWGFVRCFPVIGRGVWIWRKPLISPYFFKGRGRIRTDE